MRNVFQLGIVFSCIWTASAAGKTVTVAPDGSGDFKSIPAAIAAVGEGGGERTIIHIQRGVYEGPFVVPKNKAPITFQGDGAGETILTYDRNVYETIPPGIDKFNPTLQIRADDFRAEKLTIRNTSGDHGQALALRVDSDRAVFSDCRMLGWQDTVMVNNGRQYFRSCYIEGRVDFIYGSGTAVFEDCETHSKNGGYITAASTPQDHPFGFVFLHCKLTGDPTPWNPASTNPATTQPARASGAAAYLGRPWRDFGAVAFIECDMGDHIRPEGWNNWGSAAKEKTARYSEYGSTGPGANASQRVAWSRQLTREQVGQINVKTVLGGSDNWNPQQP